MLSLRWYSGRIESSMSLPDQDVRDESLDGNSKKACLQSSEHPPADNTLNNTFTEKEMSTTHS